MVTYHHVREAKKNKYKNLKALEFNEFIKQVKYFKKNISKHLTLPRFDTNQFKTLY